MVNTAGTWRGCATDSFPASSEITLLRLRLLDLGLVSPLRSQAIYHGLAEAMSPDGDPWLVLVRPRRPYVCLGLHQSLEREIDLETCRRHGLPLIRRQVGGGTVLLDRRQLFFQFIYPRRAVTGPVRELYPRFLAPVVGAYQALGLPASLEGGNDIQVQGRKIGGSGAAHIGQAVVVVGSFLLDFDFALMSRVARLPSPGLRPAFRRAMQCHMTTLRRELGGVPALSRLKLLFLQQLARHLAVDVVPSRPTATEWRAVREAESELGDPEWLELEGRPQVPHGVKVAAGVYLTERRSRIDGGPVCIRLLCAHGRIAWLAFPGHPALRPLARRLIGCPLNESALRSALAGGVQGMGPVSEHWLNALLETAHGECR